MNLCPNRKTAGRIQSFGLQLPDEVSNLLNEKYTSVSKGMSTSSGHEGAEPAVSAVSDQTLVSELPGECQDAMRAALAEAIDDLGMYDARESAELVEDGMGSRLCSLADTIDVDEVLRPFLGENPQRGKGLEEAAGEVFGAAAGLSLAAGKEANGRERA